MAIRGVGLAVLPVLPIVAVLAVALSNSQPWGTNYQWWIVLAVGACSAALGGAGMVLARSVGRWLSLPTLAIVAAAAVLVLEGAWFLVVVLVFG